MKLHLLILIFFVVLLSGCCIRPWRYEPSYPKDAKLGWQENNGKLSGRFVLKKGEYTEYKGLCVEVIEIFDNNCIDAFEHSPVFVKLKFVKMPEKQTICEESIVEGSFGTGGSQCDDLKNFGIFGMGSRGINVSEGWADFGLENLD